MVDRDALSARLSALNEYLAFLRPFRKHSREEFASNPAVHHLAERYLHLACECVLDIAHHVISERGYRQPVSYKDAIDVLREAGHLDASLASRIQNWMGLRNVLVHLYLAIDHGRVHDAIVEDLEDIQEFARSLAPLLGEAEPPPRA